MWVEEDFEAQWINETRYRGPKMTQHGSTVASTTGWGESGRSNKRSKGVAGLVATTSRDGRGAGLERV